MSLSHQKKKKKKVKCGISTYHSKNLDTSCVRVWVGSDIYAEIVRRVYVRVVGVCVGGRIVGVSGGTGAFSSVRFSGKMFND